MEGPPNVSYDGPDAGVLPRVAHKIFSTIEKSSQSSDSDPSSSFSYSVGMSVIEIYLERIVDLLDSGVKKNNGNEMLKIREDASGGVYLEGVVEQNVADARGLIKCLETAGKKRSTGGHAMNARSSRSHLVAIVTVTQKKEGVTTVGKMSICDLAGSEMVRKTEAEGQRLKEAKAINRSLSGERWCRPACNSMSLSAQL